MYRKYYLIIAVLCTFLLFNGCDKTSSNNEATHDSKNLIQESSEVEYALGYRVVGNTGPDYTVEYNGDPVELEYCIDNHASEAEVGVFLFVNGALQKVKGPDNKITDMTLIKAPKEEVVTQRISFIPTYGIPGETYNIRVAYVLNPNTYANGRNFIFGNNTRASTHFPFKLKINKNISPRSEVENIGDIKELTESERNKLVYTDKNGRQINMLRECRLNIFTKDSEGYNYLEFINDKITLECEVYGGGETEYFVSAIVNNVLVKNCGIISVKEGFYKTTMKIDITKSLLETANVELKEFNNLYLFVVPVDGNTDNMLIKSDTYILKCDGVTNK